ncbi:hypothetical protein HDU96_010414 [Phlyctochytrium bullatum]|nr:hypothetical protein HDU96_010414 [Phlyctochytrium bullatum]
MHIAALLPLLAALPAVLADDAYVDDAPVAVPDAPAPYTDDAPPAGDNYTAPPTPAGLFGSALDLVESKQWCKENAINCGLLTWGSCAWDRDFQRLYALNFCNVFVIRAKTGLLPWTSWGRRVTRCDKHCWRENEVGAGGRVYGREEKQCVAAADVVLTYGTAPGPAGYEDPVGVYEARKCEEITGLSTAALLSARSYIPVGRPRVPAAASAAGVSEDTSTDAPALYANPIYTAEVVADPDAPPAAEDAVLTAEVLPQEPVAEPTPDAEGDGAPAAEGGSFWKRWWA